MSVLHHIALRVGDLDAMLAFYQRWFGLASVRDQRPRSVWLSLGEGSVLMLETRTPEEPPIDPRSLELCAFSVTKDEHLTLRERLTAEGLLEAETAHTLYFRDPEGRRVAVSSYPL